MHLEVLELTSHTVTALGLCGGLLPSSSLYGTECLNRQFAYLNPLYNPVAQGNWPHSLANLPTTLYLNIESIDANIDGSEFYI